MGRVPGTRRLAAAASALLAGQALAGDAAGDIDPARGPRTWQLASDGVSLRLTQLLPDQLRGFYGARGFKPANTERIATACVFQTVWHNLEVPEPVHVDLAQWRVQAGGAPRGLKLMRDWQQEWARLGVPAPARLAFRWALFPTTQSFQQGDWNMGMITFDLPAGTRFDLHFNWRAGPQRRSADLKGVECARETTGAAP